MKHPSLTRRLLALVMAAAICFSLVPWTVFAAETGTYAQVTSAEEFTTGRYVLVTDTGYAPLVLDGSWITAAQPVVADGAVTDAAGAVWTLTVDGSSVKLTDANGVTIAPKGGNNNGIASGDYSWTWSFADGKFTFSGTGSDTVVLASNVASSNKFRGYKTATATGNPNGYPHTFTAYKLVEEAVVDPTDPTNPTEVPAEPTEVPTDPTEAPTNPTEAPTNPTEAPTDPTEAPTVPVEPESNTATLVTDAASLKAGDQIIIVAADSAFALSTNQKSNNRGQAEVTKSEDGTTVTYSEDTQVITLEAGLTDGTWAFNVGGYLYAASSSKNYLRTEETLSANSSWTVEIADGVATIKATGGNTRNWLRYNSTSSIFACYASGQNDISIYKLGGAEEEKPAGIADGDYVIWVPGYNLALSSTKGGYNNFYNVGVAVAETEGKLSGAGSTEIWTVKNNEDGSITISQNGQDLGLGDSYTSMNLGEKHSTWTLADNGDGTWNVVNVGRGNTLEYSSYGTWQASATISEAARAAVKFTPASDLVEEEPEPTVYIEDGQYVLWVGGQYNMALSSVYPNGSFYNSGVAVTMDGDKLTGYGETEVWTVTNNSDGTITLSFGGQNLGMQASYSSMSLGAVNDQWILVPTGDGRYYVKNVAREQYIQWRADTYNYFSCYYLSENDNFAINFTPAESAEEPEVPTGIADGNYVIWAPAYNMSLSSNYSGYYNAGVAVTMDGDKLTGYGETEVWTVKNNEDGTITISFGGQALGMADSFSSMTLGEKHNTWTLEDAGNGLWYVKNVGRETYIEWYASKNNWSSYYKISEGSEGMFALQFTPAESAEEPEVPTGIADGNYVIWAPAYNMALSSNYSGYYNAGVAVTMDGDKLTGYGASEVWTVKNNDDGTITLSFGDQALGMADSYSSMTLGEKHNTWTLEDAGNGLWYVKNVGRECYIEWYASNKNWSGYYKISEGSEGMFALCFTPVENETVTDPSIVEDIAQWGGMTKPENTGFIYGDKYVSGDEKDTEDVFTAVVNGAVVTPWTKGGNDDAPLYYMGGAGLGSGTNDYLQFAVNAAGWGDMELSFRLRASNSGPGSFQLQYSVDGGATFENFTTGSYAYAYTGYSGEESYPVTGEGTITDGIAKTSYAPTKYVSFVFDVPAGAENCGNLLIRLVPGTEKANGKSGAISATGTIRVDTVVLSGSPIVASDITGFVTVEPDGTVDQPTGTQLTMTSATEGATIYYRVSGGNWQTYDPANKPALETLPCYVEAYAASEGKADSVVLLYTYAAGTVEAVKFSPNGGGIYIEGESAEIVLSTATEGAAIYYASSADGENFGDFQLYTAPIVVEKAFEKIVIRAYAEKEGYTTSAVAERTFTERTSDSYQIFFGQLHSHTNISDGSGSVEEAFQHASQVKGLDFLAVTDHSNSFDGEGSGVLSQDGSSVSSEWKQGHEAAAAVTDEDFVGLYGFEMTWSNGLGHINTFNTPGWQSRTQSQFTTYSTALQNYYNTLSTVPGSISQFNHPGTTFGDFSDFAHYSETTDALITLIEVGNGEGAIGSSGYFPSYEYYTRALDKGWHVAPTNNQDNHKGLWGDANTGRTVILADTLTEEGIYDALRNYRVYATEDNDLEVYYTLNGMIMGSMLDVSDVEETLKISVTFNDPTDSAIGKVEVIVNGGLTAASGSLNASSGTVELTVPADYNYYYIKVTQTDGDIAVTAPVWVGKVEAVGISSLETGSELTIAGEEQTITAELFNNERSDLMVESLIYTNKATGEVLYTETAIASVGKESTATSSFGYTFAADGIYTVTATLKGILNGVEKTYTKDLEITVMPQSITSRIIVDGTHNNDYVNGYYAGNMDNMTAIAAAQGIDVHVETEAITPEMLESCSLLVISAPAKKPNKENTYEAKVFSDDFIAMVAQYVRNGGSVIVCGLADYQDKNATFGAEGHTAAQLNKLLSAIGSTMRINDDEAYDMVHYSNQKYRLYPENFNMDSQWCAGIQEGQVYSQYSGCTVDPGQGTWLVKGFDTTFSVDSDKDGVGANDQVVVDGTYTYNVVVPEGEAVFMAAEDTGFGGTVFVAGGVFLSDFEVSAELDNWDSLPYANRTIYENIIGITRTQPEITPIADVRDSAETELGRIFVIEGYVTSGTDNPFTTFFDAIYVQDETGGITVFPYSEEGLELGTKVRITGYTDAYQGDIEIQIMSLEVLEEPKNVIEPEKVSNADAVNYAENGGELLQVEGEVVEVVLTSDGKGVTQFVLKDENGDLAKVFIDGYILSGTTGENTLADIVKVGNTVCAVGLLYMHPEGDSEESVAVLRVRNCDEVILIKEKVEDPTDPTDPSEPSEPTDPTDPETDKSQLEKAIKTAKTKKSKDYTKKSFDAMKAALKVAEEVYADENATQEEIDAATDALNKAIKALVPATGKNPETSDNALIELSMFTMTISLLAMAALVLNRKRFTV